MKRPATRKTSSKAPARRPPAPGARVRAVAPRVSSFAGRAARSEAELVVPVLAPRADPGRTVPGPLAIRDRLRIDRSLVDEHSPERLFAYEVTRGDMRHLRGLAEPGDHVVFRRGGRATEDRICAVRTPSGVVLSRVLIVGDAVVLRPGVGARSTDPPIIEGLEAQRGVIAGIHVLVVRR